MPPKRNKKVVAEKSKKQSKKEVEFLTVDLLEMLPAISRYVGSGSTQLDLALSGIYPKGGYPVGRITQIFGKASTGKTVLAQVALGYVLRAGGFAFFADTEGTFDPVWAAKFGLDVTHPNFFYGYPIQVALEDEAGKKTKEVIPNWQPESIEELFDDYIPWVQKHGKPSDTKVIVIDSLSALPSLAELVGRLDESTYGMTRAKQFSTGYRKCHREWAKHNVALICVDQIRSKVNQSYGDTTAISGGSALEYYATTRLKIEKNAVIKNSMDREVGIEVKFKTQKNKAHAPFKDGCLSIIWEYGIDNISDNVDFLNEFAGVVDKSRDKKGWVVFKGKSYRAGDLIDHIEKNQLELELEQDVADIWNKLQQPEERIPRRWDI